MRDKRAPNDVCGEAICLSDKHCIKRLKQQKWMKMNAKLLANKFSEQPQLPSPSKKENCIRRSTWRYFVWQVCNNFVWKKKEPSLNRLFCKRPKLKHWYVVKIKTKHASNSPVTFVTQKRFALLLFLPSCCVNSLFLDDKKTNGRENG